MCFLSLFDQLGALLPLSAKALSRGRFVQEVSVILTKAGSRAGDTSRREASYVRKAGLSGVFQEERRAEAGSASKLSFQLLRCTGDVGP